MNKELEFLYKIGKTLCIKHGIDYQILNDSYELNMPLDSLGFFNNLVVDESFDQILDQSKRMMTGSYYTPDPLAKKIIELAFVDYFCRSGKLSKVESFELFVHKKICFDPNKKTLIIKTLQTMKIIDPSCGSGSFIKQAFNLLVKIYKCLEVRFSVTGIIDQLYGLDIQETPVKLLKLWLLDQVLSNQETYDLDHIICTDSLFYETILEFDLVIGNPPYIGEKGNKELFEKYKYLPGYEGKMDFFYFFIYKGLSILKAEGVLSYITTNYFITADGAVNLRRYLKNNASFLRIINLDACKLFKDAPGMHNLIFSLTPNMSQDVEVLTLSKNRVGDLLALFDVDYVIKQNDLYSENENITLYEKKDYYLIINKILKACENRLENLVNINQGIVSGADRVTQNMLDKKLSKDTILKYNIQKNDPIFVMEHSESLKAWLKPFYKNSHIEPYRVDLRKNQWILYNTDQEEILEDDPRYEHLLPYKEVLDKRREVQKKLRKWYALQWFRNQEIFESEKIVVPQRSKYNKFAYVKGPFYASADIYYLTGDYLKPLLAILNSKLIYFWLYTRGKRKGKDLELYAKPLSQIPIPDLNQFNLMDLTALVEKMMLAFDSTIQEEIDQWVYNCYDLSDEEIEVVEDVYQQRGK